MYRNIIRVQLFLCYISIPECVCFRLGIKLAAGDGGGLCDRTIFVAGIFHRLEKHLFFCRLGGQRCGVGLEERDSILLEDILDCPRIFADDIERDSLTLNPGREKVRLGIRAYSACVCPGPGCYEGEWYTKLPCKHVGTFRVNDQ